MGTVGALDERSTHPPYVGGERDEHHRPGRFIVVIALAGVVALAAVTFTVAAVLSQKDFGTAAFWSLPNRIDFCGRRYLDGGIAQGNPATFRSDDSRTDARWSLVARTLSGKPIYAVVAPLDPPQYTVCTMVLYIPHGGTGWQSYSLSGGP